jgi:cellulose synthase/poly-beta-1,6-N-acetylglucosamine synthase-like glycosyltransferase
MLALGILIIYSFLIFFIILFSLGQLALLITFLRYRNKANHKITLNSYPNITIQLPIYNERFVIERLLDSISNLNYPKKKIEIQVLDDSNDDTSILVEQKVKKLIALGFTITQIKRESRIGFKAGALQNGLIQAASEFIVIFDADFIPEPDFLINTLPYFSNDKIGMVQTRWGHINPRESWLTRAQEIGLNSHFIIDQGGRAKGGFFISFNGTAGIWRKACIEDAGGWEADTLTEDLDLSYRAQMKGWKFKYCPEIISPAELPNLLSAVRSQQFRWIKGGVETSKKLIARLWNCDLPLSIKLFGSLQLFNNYIYAFILLTGLLSVPLMLLKNKSMEFDYFFNWSGMLISVLIINFFYCFTAILMDKKNILASIKEMLSTFPIAIIVSMGMSYHNSIAVLKGIQGQKTAFIRTPKFSESKRENSYLKSQKIRQYIPESLLFIYFLLAAITELYFKDFGFLVYHLLMLSGFGFILYCAFKENSAQQNIKEISH